MEAAHFADVVGSRQRNVCASERLKVERLRGARIDVPSQCRGALQRVPSAGAVPDAQKHPTIK